jgi:hypothetical protein
LAVSLAVEVLFAARRSAKKLKARIKKQYFTGTQWFNLRAAYRTGPAREFGPIFRRYGKGYER